MKPLLASALAVAVCGPAPSPSGPWRAVLDLEGATLPFGVEIAGTTSLTGKLCNGERCEPFSRVAVRGDSNPRKMVLPSCSTTLVLPCISFRARTTSPPKAAAMA